MPGIPFLWPLVVGAAGISKTRSASRTSDGRMRMHTCLNSWGPIFYGKAPYVDTAAKKTKHGATARSGRRWTSILCCIVVLDRSVSWLDFPPKGASILGRPATLFSGDISGRGRFPSVAHFLASNAARYLPVQPSRNPNTSDLFQNVSHIASGRPPHTHPLSHLTLYDYSFPSPQTARPSRPLRRPTGEWPQRAVHPRL